MISSDDHTVTIKDPNNSNTSVTILKYGATVISWKVNGVEKIFVSDNAAVDGSAPVRGGIPLVFPRFGPATGDHPDTDKLPQHGFARRTVWEFLGELDDVSAQFALSPDQLSSEVKDQFKFDFTLLFTVKLASSKELNISMEVQNAGKQPFDFNVLFHTYFRINDITKTSISGLENLSYKDKVKGSVEKSGSSAITIEEEVDRVYVNSQNEAEILEDGKPLFTITSSPTLTDTVLWNPWSNGTEKLADFTPKSGYKNMVCVENGNVAEFTKLEGGAKWFGSVNVLAH